MIPQTYAPFQLGFFKIWAHFVLTNGLCGSGTFDEIYGNKCVLVLRRYTLPVLNPQITFQIYFTKYLYPSVVINLF